jgi:hypothetical protein
MPPTAGQSVQPINGRQAAGASAILLTQIVESAGATTFTNRSVVDAGAWTLTNVSEGNVIKVVEANGEEYRGVVSEVDAGNNRLYVQAWKKGGISGQGRAAMVPTAGRTAYVLKTDRCERLLIDALDANTADVFLGFSSSVAVSGADAGHPIAAGVSQPNHRLTIEVDLQRFIDLGNVYIIAASAQNVSWIAM